MFYFLFHVPRILVNRDLQPITRKGSTMTDQSKKILDRIASDEKISAEEVAKEELFEILSLNKARIDKKGNLIALNLENHIQENGKFVFAGSRKEEMVHNWVRSQFVRTLSIGNDQGKKFPVTIAKEAGDNYAVVSIGNLIAAYVTFAQSTVHPWTIDPDEPDIRQLNLTTLTAPDENGRMLFVPGWVKTQNGTVFGQTGLQLKHFRSGVISVCWKALQQSETPRVYVTQAEKMQLKKADIKAEQSIGEDFFEVVSDSGSSEIIAYKNGEKIAKAILANATILGSFSVTISFIGDVLASDRQIVEDAIESEIDQIRNGTRKVRTVAFDSL